MATGKRSRMRSRFRRPAPHRLNHNNGLGPIAALASCRSPRPSRGSEKDGQMSGMEMVQASGNGLAVRESRAIERALGGAAEAAAVESVRAHFVMARQCPRDILDVRKRILSECDRPG